MKEDVLTIEHLKALRDLPSPVPQVVFDLELFKANNPHWRDSLPDSLLLTITTTLTPIPIKTTIDDRD